LVIAGLPFDCDKAANIGATSVIARTSTLFEVRTRLGVKAQGSRQ